MPPKKVKKAKKALQRRKSRKMTPSEAQKLFRRERLQNRESLCRGRLPMSQHNMGNGAARANARLFMEPQNVQHVSAAVKKLGHDMFNVRRAGYVKANANMSKRDVEKACVACQDASLYLERAVEADKKKPGHAATGVATTQPVARTVLKCAKELRDIATRFLRDGSRQFKVPTGMTRPEMEDVFIVVNNAALYLENLVLDYIVGDVPAGKWPKFLKQDKPRGVLAGRAAGLSSSSSEEDDEGAEGSCSSSGDDGDDVGEERGGGWGSLDDYGGDGGSDDDADEGSDDESDDGSD